MMKEHLAHAVPRALHEIIAHAKTRQLQAKLLPIHLVGLKPSQAQSIGGCTGELLGLTAHIVDAEVAFRSIHRGRALRQCLDVDSVRRRERPRSSRRLDRHRRVSSRAGTIRPMLFPC